MYGRVYQASCGGEGNDEADDDDITSFQIRDNSTTHRQCFVNTLISK